MTAPSALPSPARLARLHYINAVCAAVTGSDLKLAGEILTGLEAALGAEAADEARFREAVQALRPALCRDLPAEGFHHCDASCAQGPLWLRETLMAGLRRIAAYRRATLLVTNLAASISPRGRWTARARREHADALAFIHALVRARTSPRSEIRIIVV